jgi:hypothetical protein
MEMQTLLDVLNQAFDKAEQETADQYRGHTCTMTDKDDNDTCPICYFRQRVKVHLGLMAPVAPEGHGATYDPNLMSTILIINGEPKSIQQRGEITFEQVVALAHGNVANPERFSVMYFRGSSGKQEGILMPGESVRVTHNMGFTVVVTGNA